MKKIFVAGHMGMVGSAICRQLQKKCDAEIITRTRDELDLCEQRAVHEFMKAEKPDEVILAAAKVGGIHANNTYPADFIYQNLQIQNNIINAAHRANIQKLLFLGSSCIYPRITQQPITESALLTGELEKTNEPYAIAKIAGIKLCESYNRQYGHDYRSVMPTNLYGPGDNYHPENSHVVPALIRRFHAAKVSGKDRVEIWGSGTPRREFLHVDDLAAAALHIHNLDRTLLEKYIDPMLSHINIGTGQDITIRQLAEEIQAIVGFNGVITFNTSKPDGTPQKLLDTHLISLLGWRAQIDLKSGLAATYKHYISNNI